MKRTVFLMCLWAAWAAASPHKDALIVHEWGTFTAVADRDGKWVKWQVLEGPSELPGFVYTLEELALAGEGLRFDERTGKGAPSLVRMETPVIYFYAGEERDVSVRVAFPEGRITEWYPQAKVVVNDGGANGAVDWGKVRLVPRGSAPLPREPGESHYYPAREVEAAQVRVCGATTEVEQFLFYRGVGDFSLPVTARVKGRQMVLEGQGRGRVNDAFVFERQGEKVGWRHVTLNALRGAATRVERPALGGHLEDVLASLEDRLVATGLYRKEAQAMVKTWRDSWFEEGLRVFYVLPTEDTDAILPLEVTPAPTERVRVLVGRLELFTPEQERRARADLDALRALPAGQRARAEAALKEKYGRFAEPLFARVAQRPK